jgi:exopolysaccharide biosynthesis WecB/TagA/CpsF family protein
MKMAIDYVRDNIMNKVGGYVCFTNVHASVMGRQSLEYRSTLNSSFMTLPDGKPLFWYAYLKGLRDVGHVPGPDFLPAFIKETHQTGLRHYFYGSTQKVLDALTRNLLAQYPEINIAGTYSPPFRKLSQDETSEIINNINHAKPDIIWIGLGAPKQEKWMEDNWSKLKPALLMGVGAAFDFNAGTIKRSPPIYTKLGIEWLHRLSQEPWRLFKRYLVTNSLFVWFLVIDVLKHNKY